MLKKGMVWGKKLIAGISLAAVVMGSIAVPTDAAAKSTTNKKSTAVVRTDRYRKTLCKGFLGKRYGAVIDGIRCDCSGYTRAALNRMEGRSKTGKTLKNVRVYARCTRDWVRGSRIAYTTGAATKGAITWTGRTKTSIGRKSTGSSRLERLELGDVMVYGKGGSTTHIAVYFGTFSSIRDVKAYLEELGIYKKGALRKTHDGKYTYKGRTIIRKYGSSKYWRIHSTNKGIMIDNDIAGRSGYTSSFGAWKWTFDSGIQAE